MVIVGAGIAGLSAAEAARKQAPRAELTLLSREAHLPYYRLNLTRFLAGEVSEADLPIHPAGWYRDNAIDFRGGVEAAELLPDQHALSLRDGTRIGFDKLILTAGAHPFVPPLGGATRQGVTSLRTLDDARAILATLQPGMRCVCVGGGILGLEAAGGLARGGAEVTVLEGHGWLMPRQLPQPTGPRMQRHLEGLGIRLRTNARTKEILGDERVAAVLLDDGATLPADLVLITTGVRPNSFLARRAGLEVAGGVVVNDQLVSSHPDVLAAGDVAEHRGVLYGTWGPRSTRAASPG